MSSSVSTQLQKIIQARKSPPCCQVTTDAIINACFRAFLGYCPRDSVLPDANVETWDGVTDNSDKQVRFVWYEGEDFIAHCMVLVLQV